MVLVVVISKSILINVFESGTLKMCFKMYFAYSGKLVTIEICSNIFQFWTVKMTLGFSVCFQSMQVAILPM